MEFALVSTMFVMLVIAVVDFGRYAYVLNAAVESTRLGARLAVVCDRGSPVVREQMQQMLPLLGDGNITVSYPAVGCLPRDCTPVTVALTGAEMPSSMPIIPVRFSVPAFSTSLTRESLNSVGNALCN